MEAVRKQGLQGGTRKDRTLLLLGLSFLNQRSNRYCHHFRRMAPPTVNFTVCTACLLFLTGKCSCFSQPGGPRATGHCHDCKCITVRFAMNQKKYSPKALFHTHPNRTCDCDVSCKINDTNRCEQKGDKFRRVAYHAKCRKYWKQCAHLSQISKELREYSDIMKNSDLPIVLSGCVPLIGYNKRKSSMIEVKNFRNFVKARADVLQVLRNQVPLSKEKARKKKQYSRCEKPDLDVSDGLALEQSRPLSISREASSVHSSERDVIKDELLDLSFNKYLTCCSRVWDTNPEEVIFSVSL